MFKSSFTYALAACLSSIGLGLLLEKFIALETPIFIQNNVFHLLVFCALAFTYGVGKKSKEFSGLLLAALVLRLLSCLVYVVVLRLTHPIYFFNAALHFLVGFIVFTIADISLAVKVIKGIKKP